MTDSTVAWISLLLSVVALAISVPAFFQMFWGAPKLSIAFITDNAFGVRRLGCRIRNVPVNRWLLNIGVVRSPTKIIAADYEIYE
jgi:hypothetical protein